MPSHCATGCGQSTVSWYWRARCGPTHLDSEASAATCEQPVQYAFDYADPAASACVEVSEFELLQSSTRYPCLFTMHIRAHLTCALLFWPVQAAVADYDTPHLFLPMSPGQRHLEHALAVGADGTWLDNMGPNLYGAKTGTGVLLGSKRIYATP